MKSIAGLAVGFLSCAMLAQQPNSPVAAMTINGADGPPFPIAKDLRTNLPAAFSYSGFPNQPYAMFQAATIQPGAASAFGDLVDLALTPFPALVFDGFVDPSFRTDAAGTDGFSVVVPTTLPVGTHVAVQTVMGDPSSPYGLSLTAATLVTVTQGPAVTILPFSDTGTSVVQVNLPFAVPFYGSNQTLATVSLDGYVAFSAQGSTDLPPSGPALNSGPPKCALFWTDLVLAQGSVTSTIDVNPGPGLSPYWKVQYTNVRSAVNGVPYDFSFRIDAAGEMRIAFEAPFGTPSPSEMQVTGISPGFSLNNASMKDLSALLQPGPPGWGVYVGNPYESIYEWFGYSSNIFYSGNPTRPFDLAGVALNFSPSGDRYIMY